MKTKELFSRYPRKISLLKDLLEGYPELGISYLKRPVEWPVRLSKNGNNFASLPRDNVICFMLAYRICQVKGRNCWVVTRFQI